MKAIHRGRSSVGSDGDVTTTRSPIWLRSLVAPSGTSSDHEKIDLADGPTFASASQYVEKGWSHRQGLHLFLFAPRQMISRSHRVTERLENKTGTSFVERKVDCGTQVRRKEPSGSQDADPHSPVPDLV